MTAAPPVTATLVTGASARAREAAIAARLAAAPIDGATAVIDGRGNIRQVLPFYQDGVLSATVRGTTGFTPFIRFGSGAFLTLGALMLLGAWFAGRRYRVGLAATPPTR